MYDPIVSHHVTMAVHDDRRRRLAPTMPPGVDDQGHRRRGLLAALSGLAAATAPGLTRTRRQLRTLLARCRPARPAAAER